MSKSVFDEVKEELEKARSRYPHWPTDIIHAAAIASEESGEVIKDCNTYYWKHGDATLVDIRKETIQAIAMWVRFLEETPVLRGG